MQAAAGIVDFLARELDDPSGGFRSALDADSDGAEGKYYVWRTADLKAAVPDEEARKEVVEVFDVDGRSFWEQGQNVLMRPTVQDNALWADEARQRRTRHSSSGAPAGVYSSDTAGVRSESRYPSPSPPLS